MRGESSAQSGAIVFETGVEFAVWSHHASQIELCLFEDDGNREFARLPMARDSNHTHRLFVDGLKQGARYGYRADGIYAPDNGLWFDPSKLLIDPYAKEIDRPFRYDPRLGIYAALSDFVAKTGASKGQLRIVLDPTERHSALTVNEYETLLMKYDLAEVLRNPVRFVAQQYRNAMKNPRAVPAKTLGYAKYDFVRVMNTGLDTLRLRGSIIEKLLARTLAVPAARFFRMRRSVSLLVSECDNGQLGIVEGPYQSPILVQWQSAPRKARILDVTLTELR